MYLIDNIDFTFKIIFLIFFLYMIDNRFELYKFIKNDIKPKQKKQEYGEVFTPLNIIEELFENLDKKYKEINNNSIFE